MKITKNEKNENVVTFKTRFLPGDIVYDISGDAHTVCSVEQTIRITSRNPIQDEYQAKIYFSDTYNAKPHWESDYYKTKEEVIFAVVEKLNNNK